VSEAVTNVVMHAFRLGRGPGSVGVTAEWDADELVMTISDDGIGFLPRTDSPGRGLGLPIIRAPSNSMSIGASASGTELRMAFGFSEPAVYALPEPAPPKDQR
jgi:serine/threonine-protein kinase RsbW